MEGPKVTAIVSGGTLLVVIIVGSFLYFLFWYKKWKISTESQRHQYKLNKLFSHIEVCCSCRRTTRNDSTPNNNNQSIPVQTGGYSNSAEEVSSSGIAYNNKKLCVAVVGVDLEVPESPIRKSAETYSVVDLNDDT